MFYFQLIMRGINTAGGLRGLDTPTHTTKQRSIPQGENCLGAGGAGVGGLHEGRGGGAEEEEEEGGGKVAGQH